MALIIKREDQPIKIICKNDTALSSLELDYDNYLNSHLDESKLTFKPNMQPTRFVMLRSLDFDGQREIMGMQLKTEVKKGKLVQNADASFMLEECRRLLIDIENPADLPIDQHLKWSRDGGDTYTSKKLMALLNSAGVVTEIYNAHRMATQPDQLSDDLKKN